MDSCFGRTQNRGRSFCCAVCLNCFLLTVVCSLCLLALERVCANVHCCATQVVYMIKNRDRLEVPDFPKGKCSQSAHKAIMSDREERSRQTPASAAWSCSYACKVLLSSHHGETPGQASSIGTRQLVTFSLAFKRHNMHCAELAKARTVLRLRELLKSKCCSTCTQVPAFW